jgi:hypothetical protein
MIIFDQLRISDDGSKMFIDVHVSQAVGEGIYLQNIVITTAENVPETVSLTSVDKYIYKENFIGNITEAQLMLDVNAFNEAFNNMRPNAEATIPYQGTSLSGPLFFVWVDTTAENYSAETPCFADEPTLGVTFDAKLLYQQAMGYTKELADDCTISDGFIDFILTYSAFKSAVETDHYCDAKTFYNQLLGISRDTPKKIGRRCGCHG